ncbi:hypothetical protein I6N91_02275 [Arthrobacter sp. MSA 4-2]|nr:hypothetical protein [Arthrobacter sp. MSA 4-2]MBJ2119805.1 hypothetical protein [Arthrobacter sp. MSA 4-2]
MLFLTDDGRALHRSLWARLMDNSPVAEGLNEAEQETLKMLLQKLERAGG